MTMIKVQSRSLAAVGYDASEKKLRVQFNSGRIYCYYAVPETEFQDLLKAESKGNHFNRYIRDAFEYKKESPLKVKGAFP